MKTSAVTLNPSVCFLAFFSVYVLFIYTRSSYAGDALNTPVLQSGDYVSMDYLQRLEETKSPLAAENNKDYNLVEVGVPDKEGENESGSENKVLEIIPILRFHEGRPEFHQSRNGVITKIYSTGSDSNNMVLSVSAPDQLSLTIGNSPPVQYRLINLNDHLRNVVIAGKYVDQSGGKYEFTKYGVAHTPQGDIAYIVGADHVLFQFDYIADIKNHIVFKLVRKGCTLDLYTVLDAYKGGYKGDRLSLWHSLRQENCSETR